MSRKLRIEYPGAMYHVMNRGDQREDVLRDGEIQVLLRCDPRWARLAARRIGLRLPPFLPRRAICNLEYLVGGKNCPWVAMTPGGGRWARIWGG
jgi:hypothetical protein